MAILTTDLQTKETTGTKKSVQLTFRRTIMSQHAQIAKQGMKAIGFNLEDEDASEVNHEDFMRGLIAKIGTRHFFCNLEGHFKSDCPQFWDAVADINHPRHEKSLWGVKANKARLVSEAESHRKEKPQELATKKMHAVTKEVREPEPVTAVDDSKIDYRVAARDALKRI